MWDRTIVNRTNYVPYEKSVNITEKKAPTDESIRLYGELQEKAFKSIIDTFKLNNNIVNGVVIAAQDQYPFISNIIFLAKFKVNGIEYKTKTEICKSEYLRLAKFERKRKIAEFLIKSISEVITFEMLKSVEKDITTELKDFL
jgi:hypothetical protein